MTFTPYAARLEPETVDAVLNLDWDGDICFMFQCENPNGPQAYELMRDQRNIAMKRNILHQYQTGRTVFLGGGYDAMLIVEADVVPPADALEKLAALDADCAYGVYVHRHGNRPINITEKYPPPAKNRGEPINLRPGYESYLAQGVIECTGGGLGCVLIRRPVLEQIDFRLGSFGDCDIWFNEDVFQAGFTQKADLSVVCDHLTPDGERLRPAYAR